ncbi:MAG TPA: hypothetical protein VGN34_21220 [Ktedonobacteraceae bacterium]
MILCPVGPRPHVGGVGRVYRPTLLVDIRAVPMQIDQSLSFIMAVKAQGLDLPKQKQVVVPTVRDHVVNHPCLGQLSLMGAVSA